MRVDLSEIEHLMKVSAMLYKCTYCVLLSTAECMHAVVSQFAEITQATTKTCSDTGTHVKTYYDIPFHAQY